MKTITICLFIYNLLARVAFIAGACYLAKTGHTNLAIVCLAGSLLCGMHIKNSENEKERANAND